MSDPDVSPAWDFTSVIDLLHSFTPDGEIAALNTIKTSGATDLNDELVSRDLGEQPPIDITPKLGDFGNLWKLLEEPIIPEDHHPCVRTFSSSSNHSELPSSLSSDDDVTKDYERPVETPTKLNVLAPKKILLRKKVTGVKEDNKPNIGEQTTQRTPRVLSSPPLGSSTTVKLDRLGVNQTTPKASPSKCKYHVEPILAFTEPERKANLLAKLRAHFPGERKRLANPELSNPFFSSNNIKSTGIHVFVDMSNIMVGFHDCIKEARNIPISTRVPRVPLSFHNLSLILERARPTYKRILVGSDRFAAIDEAGQIGYETNILERVHKAKEFTVSQKKALNGNGSSKVNGAGSNPQSGSSGSETNSGPASQRWVEQAVDEILHLKILESLVDSEAPSTIVLATGDAAEAEYSGGFLRMVERALQKGWKIELVSFSSTTSRAYRRKDFRSKWGTRFAMIELDEYVEYLLDK